jgi:ring-1,2-phenylacetyl-CoA epoxidase subunit PaaA
MQWRIKRFTNDELRQRFVDVTAPQAEFLGLRIPDPELTYDAVTGHWEFGEPDWDEFANVVAGNGPCNAQRLAHRRRAHDDGAWVREAAAAHAAKHESRPLVRAGAQ